MNIKMDGATPISGKSLCVSCKHSVVVRGQNCEEVILCEDAFYSHGNGLVPFRVASCTSFRDKNHPEKHEMEAIAWTVEARKRGPQGFQASAPNELDVTIRPPKEDE